MANSGYVGKGAGDGQQLTGVTPGRGCRQGDCHARVVRYGVWRPVEYESESRRKETGLNGDKTRQCRGRQAGDVSLSSSCHLSDYIESLQLQCNYCNGTWWHVLALLHSRTVAGEITFHDDSRIQFRHAQW